MSRIRAFAARGGGTLGPFLGLNESQDGESALKRGEAAVMENWRVTPSGSLSLRPGTELVCALPGKITALWHGSLPAGERTVAAANGKLWSINEDTGTAAEIGSADSARVSFFGFAGKLYILAGTDYLGWEGDESVPAASVAGYVPLVAVSAPPAGGGTPLEGVNRLTGSKRMRFSPDGAAQTFQLPEKNIDSVDAVLSVTGGQLPEYTVNLATGRVVFQSVPSEGTNTVEIAWTKGEGERASVAAMRFSESYSGDTDARIFLCGDGSNRCVYSDLDSNGRPSAEYFPELNVLDVDSANTPVTGLIRHYDSLLVFKPDGCFKVSYGQIAGSNGELIAAFYVRGVNRQTGLDSPGAVRLADNAPVTLCRGGIYLWKTGGSSVPDERNAVFISERARASAAALGRGVVAEDNAAEREMHFISGRNDLIWNYGRDCFYRYCYSFSVASACLSGDALLLGGADGGLRRVSSSAVTDCGEKYPAVWESGAISFAGEEFRQRTGELFLSLKPEPGALLDVALLTDQRADLPVKRVTFTLAGFLHADFAGWSFRTSRRARVRRVKIRTGEHSYLKLRVTTPGGAPCTLLAAVVPSRASGHMR